MAITYPSRRPCLQGEWGPSPNAFWEEPNIAILKAYGCDSVILPDWYANRLGTQEEYIGYYDPIVDAFDEYSIKCSIQGGVPISGFSNMHGVNNHDWVEDDYDAYWSRFIAHWEDDDRVIGYTYEFPMVVGLQWLRTQTDKLFTELSGGLWVITYEDGTRPLWEMYGYEITAEEYYQKTALLDEVILQEYIPSQGPSMLRELDYLYTNFPDMPLGNLDPTQREWDNLAGYLQYWNTIPWDTEHLTWEQQETIAKKWLRMIIEKRQWLYGKPFDILSLDCSGARDFLHLEKRGNSLSQVMAWHEAMRFVKNRAATPLIQEGNLPIYSPVCIGHDTPTDSYVNTGYEILMFRNPNRDTETFHITVESTEFELTIPSGQCGFIEPLSVKDYTDSPTISYTSESTRKCCAVPLEFNVIRPMVGGAI